MTTDFLVVKRNESGRVHRLYLRPYSTSMMELFLQRLLIAKKVFIIDV